MQYYEFIAARGDTGAVLPLAKVTVYLTDTSTLATLYDASGTPLGANPITAATSGLVGFAAANGAYDIQIASADGSYLAPKVHDLQLYDLSQLDAKVASVLATTTDPGFVAVATDMALGAASKILTVATDLLLGAASKIAIVATDLALGASSLIGQAPGKATAAAGSASAAATSAALAATNAALAGTSVVSGLVQYGTTTFHVLFGLVDANNRPALLVLDTGKIVLDLEALSAAGVLLQGGFQTVSGINQLSAENIGGSYANGAAFVTALLDSNSRVLSGFLADGTMFIGKYDSRLLGAVAANEGPALSRNGPFFSAIAGQIVAYFGTAYNVLTTEGTNSEPRPLGDSVAFLSNRQRGVTAPYIMNIDGTNQRAMLQQAVYEVYPAAGQSNTPGYISTPALTLTAPYPGQALMFAGGAGPIAEYPAVFGGSGTLTDLHEDTSGAGKGESIASSMVSALLDHELTNRPKLKVVACGSGYPGAAYTAIKKTTGPYNDIIAQVGRAKTLGDAEIAAGRGGLATKSAIVRAQILMHGETDWNNASYDTNLATLQSDFETDVRAATGQVEPVPLIITQMAALRFFAAPPDASATVKSPLLQLAASVANPKIFLAGPTYWLPTIDYAHWVNTSKRLAGEMIEKVIRKVVHEGRDWVPVSPKPFGQWTVNTGAGTILIPMNVPVGPLAFDTTLVSDPGNKGFSYTDGSGRTITNVQITGANNDQILITLSGAIGTNAVLDYAYSIGVNAPITTTSSPLARSRAQR